MKEVFFEIDKSVTETNILVAGLLVNNLSNACEPLKNKLSDLLNIAADSLKKRLVTIENLSEQPEIKSWREVMSASGLKPSTFKSSAEQLARRIIKGDFSTPLPVVTAYCAISAQYLAPLGAYDLDRLPEGKMLLRKARPTSDQFLPLGGQAKEFPLSDKVTVYAIEDEVLCFAYNVRDSKKTCLTNETQRAIFMGEAVTPTQQQALRAAIATLAAELSSCGAEVEQPWFKT